MENTLLPSGAIISITGLLNAEDPALFSFALKVSTTLPVDMSITTPAIARHLPRMNSFKNGIGKNPDPRERVRLDSRIVQSLMHRYFFRH